MRIMHVQYARISRTSRTHTDADVTTSTYAHHTYTQRDTCTSRTHIRHITYAHHAPTSRAHFIHARTQVFHILRMAAVGDKYVALVPFLSALGRSLFLALFLWVQGALLWVHFGFDSVFSVLLLLLAILATLISGYIVYHAHRQVYARKK